MDAETPVLDRYVEHRVDSMVDAGLLDEVYDIYKPGADYTRGLRQSIGVREFEDFLKIYISETGAGQSMRSSEKILNFPKDDKLRIMLEEAIDRVKLNTRRLLRRQVSTPRCTTLITCGINASILKLFILMFCFRKGESVD